MSVNTTNFVTTQCFVALRKVEEFILSSKFKHKNNFSTKSCQIKICEHQYSRAKILHKNSSAYHCLYYATQNKINSNNNKFSSSVSQQNNFLNNKNNNKHQHDSFRSDQLTIVKCPSDRLKAKPDPKTLLFGKSFSDHMLRIDWNDESGWEAPKIQPFQNFNIHPAAKVLHYALEAFEGVKAFRGHDNEIRLFRLDRNIERMLRSARRLAMPEFNAHEFEKCIHKLVALDRDWVPNSNELMTSLYIRPTIIGTEPALGVDRSNQCILYVILSPVGPYFKEGFKPVSLYANSKYVRAWPGGAGNTKLGSNYAPTISHQKVAERLNLQQILWLFGEDQKLTEVGCMNIMVCIKDSKSSRQTLVTPPLDDGLILPGIVRDSIVELVNETWSDVDIVERYINIAELKQLVKDKNLIEMFGVGTACVVCPIKSIHLDDGATIHVPTPDQKVSVASRILKEITDIQYGIRSHKWARELDTD